MAKQSISNWQGRYKSPLFWWVTFFGSGLIKPAPGTWGSYAALMVGYILIIQGITLVGLLTATLLITIVSIIAINKIEAETGIHDAPEIVIDEVAGQWLAMVPLLYFTPDIGRLLVAFLLFRIFDILKPWPIRWLDEKVGGGFGVMIDDILAGIISGLLLYAALSLGYL